MSIYRSPKHPKIELCPHPQAPLFQATDAQEVLRQALSLVESGNFSSANEEIRQVLRQAGFVSLWFFLKVIAGYNGPYDKLTYLHIDMANYYQKMRVPGARMAAFLPRGMFKSTVLTHGANTWDILRNPDITIGLCSAIIDRSQEFLEITERTFDSNDFFAWLYPEYVTGDSIINRDEFVVPNRSRFNVQPTIKIFAVGGSTQGIHVDVLRVDDPVGDAQLDSDRMANADMRRIEHWLKSNIRTLLTNPNDSIVSIVGTRYAREDAYQFIFDNTRSLWGYYLEDEVTIKPDGKWDVYYRMVEEDGELLFPERVTKEFLQELAEEDPWTLWTQYYNRTSRLDTTEFLGYTVKKCWVEVIGERWYVHTVDEKQIPLERMDVVQACDPAATEKRMSAKTSRSAVVVYARDKTGKRFILQVQVGYVEIKKMFDWMFQNMGKYPIRCTILETQGPFKVLYKWILTEQQQRNTYLHVKPVSASTDKDVRIRTALQPVLSAGLVYATEQALPYIEEELRGFPNSLRKDVLDALAMAEAGTIAPVTEEEEIEYEEWRMAPVNPVTGY